MKLGTKPGRIALDDLFWPLGQAEGLKGGKLGDLAPDDHLVVFPRNTLHARPSFGTRAKVSIMVLEPAAIHAHHFKLLRVTHRRFFRVLSCNEDLLSRIPNGLFFPFGGTWVPGWRDLDLTKSRMCSLIASAKKSEEGHVLRHALADWVAVEGLDIDTMGGGYKPFKDKSDGLAPYRYSLVIENVRERNYFTEKLVDAILCRTVPIYWGCPNIGDFFDTSGMIICQSEDEMKAAVMAMSEGDYANRLPKLETQRGQADHLGDFYKRAAQAVLGSI